MADSAQYQGRSRSLRPSCCCKTASFAAVFVITGTASAVAFYVGARFSQLMSPTRICLTSNCIQLADKAAALLDTSANPCDNFYRFACGGAPSSATTHPDLAGKDVLNRVQRLLAQWAVEDDMQTSLQESAALYQNCLAVTNGGTTGIRDLEDLLRKRKIDVTNQDSSIQPLDAVLSLEIRDNIKTIFEIAVGRRYMVAKRRRNLGPWYEQRKMLVQKHVYRDYIQSMFLLMGTKSKIRINMLAGSVWRSEDHVISLSSKFPKGKDGRSHGMVFLINANGPAVLMRPEWKNNLLRFWYKFAIEGAELVAYLDRLFDRLGPPDMIYYIYWEVIRQLGPFADPRFRVPDEDSRDTADHCFRAIFHLAGLPALAMVIAQDVTSETIIAASSFVTGLVRRAGLNATISIVDPRQIFRPPTFVGRRGEVTDVSVSFLRAYLNALVASRQAELISIEMVIPRRPGLKDLFGRHVSFDGKTLSVPTSLLMRLLFSAEAPLSFKYAGLGYEVLLEPTASGALNETSRRGCEASEIPGHKARALDALWSLFGGDGGSLDRYKLPGSLEVFTEGQLMFLALCQKTCTAKDANACNVPLRSLPAFASAFECQRGSYMRPVESSRCVTHSTSSQEIDIFFPPNLQ